jgi:hypothetical protein
VFRKIRWAVRIAIDVTEARELVARDPKRAMALLDSVYVRLVERAASPELNLLRSQVAIKVENGPLALLAAETALQQLEGGYGRYRQADRTYLVEYARFLIRFCESWRDRKPPIRQVDLDLDLARASARLKRDFPFWANGAFPKRVESSPSKKPLSSPSKE